MYTSNYLAEERAKSVKLVIVQVIFLMTPLSGLFIYLMYIINKDSKTAQMLILFMVLPYSLAVAVFLIFAVRLMIKRWNRTISSLNIDSGNLTVKTFPIFWYRPRNYSSNISNITLENRSFQWYGKEKKEGIKIKIGNDDLYFVNYYFDDYDKILNNLSAHDII